MFEYDEERAVEFIQNYLPQELKEKLDDDDIYYFLDAMCEFYDKSDWLSEEDEEKEEEELIQFLIKQAVKDEIGKFTKDEIKLLLVAESAYSDSLDIPEDDD
ncbi:MAG: hypothetical protein FWF52_08910 [Candidatus Azobacteroides sp.]|nr:hypothetical protein [Candidatus Azobacteroides sp.]